MPAALATNIRDAVVADYQTGIPATTVAERHHITPSTVYRWLDAAGVPRRQRHHTPPATCTVDGCPKPVKARSWCDTHYSQWHENGGGDYRPRLIRPTTITQDDLNRLEDVTWMADTGEHLAGAAHRLGVSRDTLYEWLRNLSRHHREHRATLDRLLAREPAGTRARGTT